MSRYQKGKTNLDVTEAKHNEWQSHQLGHMQSAPRPVQITTPAPNNIPSKHCLHLYQSVQHQSVQLVVHNTTLTVLCCVYQQVVQESSNYLLSQTSQLGSCLLAYRPLSVWVYLVFLWGLCLGGASEPLSRKFATFRYVDFGAFEQIKELSIIADD